MENAGLPLFKVLDRKSRPESRTFSGRREICACSEMATNLLFLGYEFVCTQQEYVRGKK